MAIPSASSMPQRAGVRARLTGTGLQPNAADRWLDAWMLKT
jgi:hypothetical protein